MYVSYIYIYIYTLYIYIYIFVVRSSKRTNPHARLWVGRETGWVVVVRVFLGGDGFSQGLEDNTRDKASV